MFGIIYLLAFYKNNGVNSSLCALRRVGHQEDWSAKAKIKEGLWCSVLFLGDRIDPSSVSDTYNFVLYTY